MEWYRNLDGTAEVKVFWKEDSSPTGEYLSHTYEMYVVDGPFHIPIAGYRYVEKDDAWDYPTHISMRAIEVKALEMPSFGKWVKSDEFD